MRTLGVDLSAEPAKTAIAVVDWSGGSAVVSDVQLGADDAGIAAAADGVTRIGIDAPFGWPDAFVAHVSAHHRHQRTPRTDLDSKSARAPMTRRRTDHLVHQRVGLVPLSVSADLIGHVAMRCTGLLQRLGVTDRVTGWAVEAYPAAALRRWGIGHRGYKSRDRRATLGAVVDQFTSLAPALDFGERETLCRTSDDAFDAVVAACIARATHLGRTELPSAADHLVAEREGWIHVPAGPLADLVGP